MRRRSAPGLNSYVRMRLQSALVTTLQRSTLLPCIPIMHPWVWQGARSLWQSGHYREAVTAAAIKVNAETQNKIGSSERSEYDLFTHLFKPEPPSLGHPRLRLQPVDGTKSGESRRRGAQSLGQALYTGIRNPASHDEQAELGQAEALEQLAAFSILARWVDGSRLYIHGT